MRHIILASQSPQRKTIFDTLGLSYKVLPAHIDEQAITAPTQRERAPLVAQAKARAIQADYPDAIIVAADTYVVIGERALEKPRSIPEARQMLQQQSGQTVVEYTGFCYLDQENGLEVTELSETQVTFRPLSTQEIEAYVTSNPVLTWSGAFCPAYPAGAGLIARIEGSFTGFTHGLPLELVAKYLAKSGVWHV